MNSTGKTYNSVEEMLEGMGCSSKFLKKFNKQREKRKLADSLAIARCKAEMTPKQLAKRIGKTKKWVEKIEFSSIDDLTIGQINRYLKGLDRSLIIKIGEVSELPNS